MKMPMTTMLLCFLMMFALISANALGDDGVVAPKPLYRDPVHDGAADPVVIWNRQRKCWFMFYTNRRANVPNLAGVTWVHGTRIGIASSIDGANWTYERTADIAYGTDEDTHWAPDVIEHEGVYHMFLTFVPGTHADWNADRRIVHLQSDDLIHWGKPSEIRLSSDRVIDASIFRMPDGSWRMWYNNERDHKSIYWASSTDLMKWTDQGKCAGEELGAKPGEGPKVFRWKGAVWMIVDHWHGLGVYRSEDATQWTRQPTLLVDQPGAGADDGVIGHHADVVVSGERAYLFYFTHPGRVGENAKKDGMEQRRSSIQICELFLRDGKIVADRDVPTRVMLISPR